MFWEKRPVSLETRMAEAVFEKSPDGMLLAQKGVFVACNQASMSIYGRSREAIIGARPEEFAAPIQSDGRASALHVPEQIQRAHANGSDRFEWLCTDGQGRELKLLGTLIPVHFEGDDEVLVLIQSLGEVTRVVDELRYGLKELSIDTWGHEAGDRALVHAAQIFQAQIRSGDAAGRLGGDEFLLFLKDASIAEAEAICGRIRATLRQTTIAMDTKTDIMLSLSCGIAGSSDADTFQDIYSHADKALYMAKFAGRNTVRSIA